MKKSFYPVILVFILFSCKKEVNTFQQTDAINQEIKNDIQQQKALFDWNNQSTDFIFKALQTCDDRCITIGYKTDFKSSNATLKEAIIKEVEKDEGLSRNDILLEDNDKLATLKFSIHNKKTIEDIRHFTGVDFIELTSFKYDREFFMPDEAVNVAHPTDHTQQRLNSANPGNFDPSTSEISYDQYIGYYIHGRSGDVMRNHNLTYIYDSLKKFDGVEVAVLDNGVLADDIPYVQVGYPAYQPQGYYCPNVHGTHFDGPNPRNYDLGGLSMMIAGLFSHGTEQTNIVYEIIPKGKFTTVRASQFVFFISPNDFVSTTRSIMAMADDPNVKVISMSMGTIFVCNEMKRAIQYFTSKDKIFVSAAGTFLDIPAIKNLIGVVFPANMPETIATTGIEDTKSTNGAFVLGETSTSGPETDFVIDYSSASSETVSATAAMFGLVWGINPNLSAAQITDIFIKSSTFYNSTGHRDPIFGWGKVDCKMAAKAVQATL